jgi:hypothetical protein
MEVEEGLPADGMYPHESSWRFIIPPPVFVTARLRQNARERFLVKQAVRENRSAPALLFAFKHKYQLLMT